MSLTSRITVFMTAKFPRFHAREPCLGPFLIATYALLHKYLFNLGRIFGGAEWSFSFFLSRHLE